jgi:hypothetical protein
MRRGFDANQRFKIGDDRTQRVAVEGTPCRALAWSTNWPPLGALTGVTIDPDEDDKPTVAVAVPLIERVAPVGERLVNVLATNRRSTIRL